MILREQIFLSGPSSDVIRCPWIPKIYQVDLYACDESVYSGAL